MATDYRPALCRFEDNLFRTYRIGHQIISEQDARDLVDEVFDDLDMEPPELVLVNGFSDPQIGGYADVATALLASGADIKIKNFGGYGALDLAARSGLDLSGKLLRFDQRIESAPNG